jgi:5-methylcytosine-specific restriction protein A
MMSLDTVVLLLVIANILIGAAALGVMIWAACGAKEIRHRVDEIARVASSFKHRDLWEPSSTTVSDRAFGQARSGRWPRVRLEHLKDHPTCAVCGGKTNIEVHHIEPFHLCPERELDPTNLLTLCEAPGHNCHFIFGHLLSWRSYNPMVRADAFAWRERIEDRPSHVDSDADAVV